MHITDFHPDPYYKTGATFDSGCHERPKKKKKKKGGKGKGKGMTEVEEADEEVDIESEDLARHWGSAVS